VNAAAAATATLEQLLERRLVPVVVLDDAGVAVALAHALPPEACRWPRWRRSSEAEARG
jgi:hypothetical protein